MKPTTCWSTEEFRRHGEVVLELLAQFIDEGRHGKGEVVRIRPVEAFIQQMELGRLMADGINSDKELAAFVSSFLEGATNLQHPGYMAHQVALPHYAAALADLISGTLNNGMSVYEMGPTAGVIEVAIIDWMLAKIGWQPTGRNQLNLPASGFTAGGGVLTHGGSLANFTAMLAARAAAAPEAWKSGTPDDLVVLAPAIAHYSLSRAVAALGLGTDALVEVPSDSVGRCLPEQLPTVFDRVIKEGRRVMAVCANACATATGLYDPLQEIGAFCRERDLWFHVDGAHGASALLNSTEGWRLNGLDLADSIVWDAHKLLQTSALCAAVLVRNGNTLAGSFQQDAVYVTEGDREVGVDFIGHQFECTKAPLGLKLLLTVALIGEEGLESNIGILWENTRRFHDRITSRPGFETLCPPESNILCFRYQGDDQLQSRVRQDLMKQGDFLVSQADVAGRRWLRLTIMNPLTDETTIDRLLDKIEYLTNRIDSRS